MEVKDILVKEEASHDDLSGLHPAHESLESAVVAESVHETAQSMHETPSSWTPSAMRPAPQGEEGAEMTRDPTVSLHPAFRIQMNRTPVTLRRLHPNRLRKMIYNAQFLVKEHNEMMNEAMQPPRKTHVVWELYCGKGRLSDYVNSIPGCRAEKFGYGQGWDFSRLPTARHSFVAFVKKNL